MCFGINDFVIGLTNFCQIHGSCNVSTTPLHQMFVVWCGVFKKRCYVYASPSAMQIYARKLLLLFTILYVCWYKINLIFSFSPYISIK